MEFSATEDTDNPPLDGGRPWLDDPNDLPQNQDWVRDMFVPFGHTSRLHFSRVWTFCFLLCLAVALAPPLTFGIIGMAGLDIGGGLWMGWAVAFGIVYLGTLIISFIAHIRRLTDAGKPTLLAVIVMIPLILGASVGVATLSGAEGIFQGEIEKKTASYEEKDRIPNVTPTDQATAEILGLRQNQFARLDGPAKERALAKGQLETAIKTASFIGGSIWALLSIFVLLWQTLWLIPLPSSTAKQ